MRALLDTNIVIHREASTVVRDDIGVLFRWLDSLGYTKCVHPATVTEIERHADERTRNAFRRKLTAYHQLRAPAALRPSVISVATTHDSTPNDVIDTQLLNEVVVGTVDLLISEDRKIRTKARALNIADRVFTIVSFLEKVVFENPDLVDYRTLGVRKELMGRMPVEQSFFDSFRQDYPGFNRWFARKADEAAYVCEDGGQLVAFMYLKVENDREPYPDVTPQMPVRRRLKIGTLKVELNGFKLGERFLKIAFDNAIRQRVDEIYVTLFRRSMEQERLAQLLEEFGFGKYGEKTGPGGTEDVYVRSMAPRFGPSDPKITFPFLSLEHPWYLVPIYPDYHTTLLPDSILNNESPEDFVEQEPHRNAIRKVYVSRSIFRDLTAGDALVFYRTGGYHRSVVTTLGIVDAIHLNIRDEREFIALCRKRSVFSDDELRAHWNYSRSNRPFVVEFLYAYALPKRPNMAALIEAGVIRDVSSAPRGFERLSRSKASAILRLSEADMRLIID